MIHARATLTRLKSSARTTIGRKGGRLVQKFAFKGGDASRGPKNHMLLVHVRSFREIRDYEEGAQYARLRRRLRMQYGGYLERAVYLRYQWQGNDDNTSTIPRRHRPSPARARAAHVQSGKRRLATPRNWRPLAGISAATSSRSRNGNTITVTVHTHTPHHSYRARAPLPFTRRRHFFFFFAFFFFSSWQPKFRSPQPFLSSVFFFRTTQTVAVSGAMRWTTVFYQLERAGHNTRFYAPSLPPHKRFLPDPSRESDRRAQ
jgi:hypothetical protein